VPEKNLGPARFEFSPERDGVTIYLSGQREPSDVVQFSLSRSDTARIVELMCKNAGLPAPWTGQSC
jgi:hypothetical protein